MNAQEIALYHFRRDYGIAANPEDMPAVWDAYLTDAYHALHDDPSGLEDS